MPTLTVSREITVLNTDILLAFAKGGVISYGFTLHNGILVIWDEDQDRRVLNVIDREWPALCNPKPLLVQESEGNLEVLWANETDADFGFGVDSRHYFPGDGDTWPATHYYLDEDGDPEGDSHGITHWDPAVERADPEVPD